MSILNRACVSHLVSSRDANSSAARMDILLKCYSVANEKWERTKAECDRIAARDAYNAWATAFLGDEAFPVIVGKDQHWGFR